MGCEGLQLLTIPRLGGITVAKHPSSLGLPGHGTSVLEPEGHRQASTGWSPRLHLDGGKVEMSLLGLLQSPWKLWPPRIRGETALSPGVLVGA